MTIGQPTIQTINFMELKMIDNLMTSFKHLVCKILCIKQCQCLWKSKGVKNVKKNKCK
jgi:hypothetical protein